MLANELGDFEHVTTYHYQIFMCIIYNYADTKCRKQFNHKIAVDCFISMVSLCEN